MPAPERGQLEDAAKRFFAELVAGDNVRRDVDLEAADHLLGYNEVVSLQEIGDLEDQLCLNQFDHRVGGAAVRMASQAGISLDEVDDQLRLLAKQLAARAQLEALRRFVHALRGPWKKYLPEDELFATDPFSGSLVAPELVVRRPPSPPLAACIDEYLRRERTRGVGQSHLDETARALGWLKEVAGSDCLVGSVTKATLRGLRNGLQRLRAAQGKSGVSFELRQTNDPARWIKSQTAARYWRSIRSFFKWAADEGLTNEDPSKGLEIALRRGEPDRTPEPFSADELQRLFRAPLFSGHRSSHFINTPGKLVERGSMFWAGLLSLLSGMRAAEINQLQFGDFLFDEEVPIVRVRLEDDTGARTKRAKTKSSVRAIPIAGRLLQLGLREFVESRRRLRKTGRVFFDVRTGTRDRKSDGLTKGWKRVLEVAGVHKPGRSFHVLRHTFTAAARSAGAREDVIAAVLGHTPQSMTGRYGGGQFPLRERADAVNRADFGLDIVVALGGPYDARRHRA
jgi:integrase